MAEETGSQVGANRRDFAASSSVEGARRDGGLMSSQNADIKSGGVRDRSSRRPREGENDSVSNLDALSIGSRGNPLNTGIGLPGFSPPKAVHTSSVGQDQYTNRTQSQANATPYMGNNNQIFVSDMGAPAPPAMDDGERALREELNAARERYRKLEADWQRRVDE